MQATLTLRPTITRRDVIFFGLAGLIIAIYMAFAAWRSEGGFPLDDGWIHHTYARNLATSLRWAYVPGVPSAGSTSPFWTLLLTVGYVLRVPFLLWNWLLGAASLALAAGLGARMAERLYPNQARVGWWTGLAMLGTWHLVWAAASGMETMLFGALCLLLIWLAWQFIKFDRVTDDPKYVRNAGIWFGIVAAVTTATRPEGGVLAFLIWLAILLSQPPQSVHWLWGAILGGIIGLTPYALLNWALSGTPLPNTFSAKQAEYAILLERSPITNLINMLSPLAAGMQLLLVPAALLTVRKIWRTNEPFARLYGLPLAWSALLVVMYSLRLPVNYQHGRYVIPALPSFIAFSVGGLTALMAKRQRATWQRLAVQAWQLATVLVAVIMLLAGMNVYATDVQWINSDMVKAAKWVAKNIPPEQLLAAHDIGALGYFAPRPLFDLAGLISTEIVPIITDYPAQLEAMRAKGVRYVMVLPVQFDPSWADSLCERFNAGGLMGGMRVYELVAPGTCAP